MEMLCPSGSVIWEVVKLGCQWTNKFADSIHNPFFWGSLILTHDLFFGISALSDLYCRKRIPLLEPCTPSSRLHDAWTTQGFWAAATFRTSPGGRAGSTALSILVFSIYNLVPVCGFTTLQTNEIVIWIGPKMVNILKRQVS